MKECEPCICELPSRDLNKNLHTIENLFIRSCSYLGIQDPELLKNKGRLREVVEPRQMIMTFMQGYGFKLKAIGRFFNRDHTTVIHSRQTIKDLCDSDSVFRHHFEAYEKFMKRN